MELNGSNTTTDTFNDSNQDDYYDLQKLKQPYIIVYLCLTSISSLIGVCGNLMTLATVCVTKALHQTRNAFIVNLAIADLLVTGIVMPFSIYGVMAGKAYFDHRPTLCSFLATVCAPGCLVSMYTICWIGCTRYFYICKFPLYDKLFSKKRTACFIASIWATGFLVHFPNHVGWGSSRYSSGFQLCTLDMENLSYSFFYGCFQVGAMATTFVFYLKIYQTVRKSRASVKMITGNDNQQDETHFLNEIKLAKTSFKIFVIFVCTWTPTALLILMGINGLIPTSVYLYSVYMAHSNSALNFFIYYVDNEMFKAGFKTLVKKILVRKSNRICIASNPGTTANMSQRQKSKFPHELASSKTVQSADGLKRKESVVANRIVVATCSLETCLQTTTSEH